MYLRGELGLDQNNVEAARWYRASAEQGFAAAQTNLGFMYMNGLGVDRRDDETAMAWFRQAAGQGNPQAQFNMGFMYEKGRGGTTPNYVEAFAWYSLAVAQGFNASEEARDEIQKEMDPGERARARERASELFWLINVRSV